MYKFIISDKETKELLVSWWIWMTKNENREDMKLTLKAWFLLNVSMIIKNIWNQDHVQNFIDILQEDTMIRELIKSMSQTKINDDFDSSFILELSKEEINSDDEIPDTVEALFNK